jgi:nitroreductase
MIEDLIRKNRSYRRFKADIKLDEKLLVELIELARFSASAANRQAIRFYPVTDPVTKDKVFDSLGWAGYLNYWNGPDEKEKPSAYIIFLTEEKDRNSLYIDIGIYAQSILLGAVEMKLGGCMFGSIKREELKRELNIPDNYNIPLILALGVPDETIVLEDTRDDIKYWRDENNVHHVPKRILEDLLYLPED